MSAVEPLAPQRRFLVCDGNEAAALAALAAYAPRYAKIFSRAQADFVPPDAPAAFAVVERLARSSTTALGAPDQSPAPTHIRAARAARLQTSLAKGW